MAFLTATRRGESTPLKLIQGLSGPAPAKSLRGYDITPEKPRSAVFAPPDWDDFPDHLLMDRTACDNVAIPLIIAG